MIASATARVVLDQRSSSHVLSTKAARQGSLWRAWNSKPGGCKCLLLAHNNLETFCHPLVADGCRFGRTLCDQKLGSKVRFVLTYLPQPFKPRPVHVSHPLEQVVVEAYEVRRFRHFLFILLPPRSSLGMEQNGGEDRPIVDSGRTIKAGSLAMIMLLCRLHYDGVSSGRIG
jgi:hypothetical protein